MSALQFTVLCPNGRRVVVKGDKQKPIVQIIEEACNKQGLKSELYDLKHLQRVLDSSSNVRYSNVPNKAQLELVESLKPRKEGNVRVNLTTSQSRLISDFPSSTSLWSILAHHSASLVGLDKLDIEDGKEPTIVYTRQRIGGEQLQTTSLKSLGVGAGNCTLRYFRQTVNPNGPTQANVCSLLKPKVVKKEAIVPPNRPEEIRELPMNIELPDVQQQSNEPIAHPEPVSHSIHPDVVSSHSECPDILPVTQIKPDVLKVESKYSSAAEVDYEAVRLPEVSRDVEMVEAPGEPYVRIPLGSHESILYSLGDATPAQNPEEDDSFFELTSEEVVRRQAELTREVKMLDEAPLMTKQLRELEKSKRILSTLNEHPVTVLRIVFPDNHVIQASFKPHSTVNEVHQFVTGFLVDRSIEFQLLSGFPPEPLPVDASLVDCHCTPKARLLFRSAQKRHDWLSEETLSKKSSSNAADTVVDTKRVRRSAQDTGNSLAGPSRTGSKRNIGQGSTPKDKDQKLRSLLKLHK